MAAVETASAFTVSTASPTQSMRTREPLSSPRSWGRRTPRLHNNLQNVTDGAADEFALAPPADLQSQSSIRSLLDSYAAERDAILARTAAAVAEATQRMAESVHGVEKPGASLSLLKQHASTSTEDAPRVTGLVELLAADAGAPRQGRDGGALDRWECAQRNASTRLATLPRSSTDAGASPSYRKATFQ
jgi:hypothetical protein